MANYIELFEKSSMHSTIVKGIHYPDFNNNMQIDMCEQIKMEYIELGRIGKPVKADLNACFNFIVHSLQRVVIYLDENSKNYTRNIEWLESKAKDGVAVYAFAKDGTRIEIDGGESDG